MWSNLFMNLCLNILQGLTLNAFHNVGGKGKNELMIVSQMKYSRFEEVYHVS